MRELKNSEMTFVLTILKSTIVNPSIIETKAVPLRSMSAVLRCFKNEDVAQMMIANNASVKYSKRSMTRGVKKLLSEFDFVVRLLIVDLVDDFALSGSYEGFFR